MNRNAQQRISQSRTVLENPYAHLNGDGGYDALVGAGVAATSLINKAHLLSGSSRGRGFSRNEIKGIVRALHAAMWRRREEILGSDREVDPFQLLDPVLALRALGYKVSVYESLGEYMIGGDSFEVAGIVDNSMERVQLSRHFNPRIRNFTAAHELGHAVLHEGSGLHRDRASDGTNFRSRDPQESEADAFASFFLMPERLVRAAFETRFLAESFKLGQATAFALESATLSALRDRCRTQRELARTVAAAQRYNGVHFKSLAEVFRVSVEVMAIRLDELGLVSVG